jgi:hypothetical protein
MVVVVLVGLLLKQAMLVSRIEPGFFVVSGALTGSDQHLLMQLPPDGGDLPRHPDCFNPLAMLVKR